jgi:hypothetical protein
MTFSANERRDRHAARERARKAAIRARKPRRTSEARFWAKVDRSAGPEACWPWLAARDKDGYGRVTIDRLDLRAARVVLAFDGRAPRPDEDACHTCDNPPCCNPRHLFAAPSAVNTADRHAKGRDAAGSGHGMAKLTPEAVREIRALRPTHSLADLAVRFNVSPTAIWFAATGTTWASV